MVSKCVIEVSLIWLNGNIYMRKHLISTSDVQTRNVGQLRYVALRENAHILQQRRRRNANIGATSAVDRDDADQCRRWANVAMLAGKPLRGPIITQFIEAYMLLQASIS